MKRAGIFFMGVVIMLITITGCQPRAVVPIAPTEAAQKFQSIIDEEFKIPLTTKETGKTFWVYVPVKENFFIYKAAPNMGTNPSTPKASTKPSLRFVEARFDTQQFIVNYDISLSTNYATDPGYKTDYSDDFKKKQQYIMSALQRAFEGSAQPPRFIVMVIADITNGVEMESIIYFDDLLRAMSLVANLPQEEFAKRYVTEFRGNTEIVDNDKGTHLNYRDIAMEEFLSRQIENRVRFKYQQSAFPPSEESRDEILNAAKEALGAYKFTDYKKIEVRNLNLETN